MKFAKLMTEDGSQIAEPQPVECSVSFQSRRARDM